MDDEEPTEPAPRRRAQTATERDIEGLAAKRLREAVPAVIVDEDSAAIPDPDARAAFRANRPTGRRLAIMEAKYERLVQKFVDDTLDARQRRRRLAFAIAERALIGAGGYLAHWLMTR